MLIRIAVLWLSLVLPSFAAVAIGGPTGLLPHAVFHPIYIACLIVTVVIALRLHACAQHRGIRALAIIVAACASVAIVGQSGEEFVVMLHGGLSAPDHLIEEADHLSWAIPGLLGIFAANFATAALSIIIATALLRRNDRRGWATMLPSILDAADFILAVLGMRFAQMSTLTMIGCGILAVVAIVSRHRPTPLDRGALPTPTGSGILTT